MAACVLYNRCPHKGAKVVADGEGCAGKFFRCPYHAWTFKLDGSHLGVPLKQGLEGTSYDPADPTFSMRRLARVDSYRGFVFASQSAEARRWRTSWAACARPSTISATARRWARLRWPAACSA